MEKGHDKAERNSTIFETIDCEYEKLRNKTDEHGQGNFTESGKNRIDNKTMAMSVSVGIGNDWFWRSNSIKTVRIDQ